jgi:hypothetical protein
MSDYNGWKNRATWNVALWLGNDEGLYLAAVEYVDASCGHDRRISWDGFIAWAGLRGERTPDGYKFDGRGLDRRALAGVLAEYRV